MNKFFFLLLVFCPLLSIAQEAGNPEYYFPKKSHWITTFGAETMLYPTPYSFGGAKKGFKPGQQGLWGARLGFGREFKIIGGLMTSTKLEGYYMGTLFERSKTAGKADTGADVDIKFSNYKQVGQIFGGDVVQTLSYVFTMNVLNPLMQERSYMTIEPFVEIGYGAARTFQKLDYFYLTSPYDEFHKHESKDELINQKFGGGINFTSSTGFFLYLRATQNRYTVTKRITDITSRKNGVTSPKISTIGPAELEKPIMIYAIGGGYKF